jgi:hypothetical protein
MSANNVNYKQDLPPPGGYKKITTGRVPTWAPRSGAIVAAIAVFTPLAVWDFRKRFARNV